VVDWRLYGTTTSNGCRQHACAASDCVGAVTNCSETRKPQDAHGWLTVNDKCDRDGELSAA
jgi:hypothetical protein